MKNRRRKRAPNLPYLVVPQSRSGSGTRKADPSWTVLIALSLILALTLVPGSTSVPAADCLWCGEFATADFLLNVALFVPLGLALGVSSGVAAWAAILIALVVSGGVELAQLAIPGRYPTVSDVLANLLGAVAGLLIARRVQSGRRLTGRRADRATLIWAIGVIGLVFGTDFLLAPSLPDTDWNGTWTPLLPSMSRYPGRVLEAELAGLQIPDGPISRLDSARHLILAGDPVSVRFETTGAPGDGLSPVLRLESPGREGILLIGVHSTDVQVRLRRRSNDLLLHAPDVFFRQAAPATGDTTLVMAAVRRGRLCVTAPPGRSCSPLSSPGGGWSMLVGLPASVPDWLQIVLDGAWLAALFFPLGMLMRRRRSRLLPSAAALCAVGIGALGGPALVLFGSLGGALTGFALGRIASLHGRSIFAA
jgi:VanZ family protein